MFLIVLRELVINIVKLRPLELTRREVELGANRPIALPYLKAAVAVSKGTRYAVLFYAKYISKELF